MHDQKKFALARVRLDALRTNIPTWIDEQRVGEYHSIVDALQTSSGEDLATFRIPESEIKPKVASRRKGTRRVPPRTVYTEKKYCDDGYFRRQVQSLWQYVQTLESQKQPGTQINGPKDYWALTNSELEQLAMKYNIPPLTRTGPHLEHWFVDRDRIIAVLVERDSALRAGTPAPETSNVLNVENMYGSSIQQGTQGSNVTINFKAKESELRTALNRIQNSIDELKLTPAAHNQLSVDIGTIEVQLSSPNPKSSIITECLQSVRTILENAAGSLIASGLAVEVGKYLG